MPHRHPNSPFLFAALVSLSLATGVQSRESVSVLPGAWELFSPADGMVSTSLKSGSILKVTSNPHGILHEISGNRLATIGGHALAAELAAVSSPDRDWDRAGQPSGAESLRQKPTKMSLSWRKLPGPGIIRFEVPSQVRRGVLVVLDQEGREVRQLRPMGNNPAILWDGRNRSGKQMAGGIYRAELRSEGPVLASWVLISD